MADVIIILFFVVLLAFPGFYVITRKIFPGGSRKAAFWLSGLVTAVLVGILTLVMAGVSL